MNNKLIVGINDLNTTTPWIIEYLKDKDDAFKYSKGSGKKIVFKCPLCGYETKRRIQSVASYKFICKMCYDGYSRPNKFIRSLLPKLSLDNLIFEYNEKWTNGKFYDAYFEINNDKYIIEMDGSQHRNDCLFGTKEEQKANDDYKDYLAKMKNINIIRIICECQDYESIIYQFQNSILKDKIKENNIDWKECIRDAEGNYVKKICEYYNNHPNIMIKDICNKFLLTPPTVRKYLKIGTKINWCNYNPKEQKKMGSKILYELTVNPIDAFDKNGNLILQYDSITECVNDINIKFPNKKINRTQVYFSCRSINKFINGFRFKYRDIDIIEIYKQDKLLYDICDYCNTHKDSSITNISNVFNMGKNYISMYIDVGIYMGICTYKKRHIRKGLKVICSDNTEYYFKTRKDCINKINEIYGEKYISEYKLKNALKFKDSATYKQLTIIKI